MLLSPYTTFTNEIFLNQVVRKRFLCNLLEINANTTGLQKLLVNSVESIELKNNKNIDNYFENNKIIRKVLQQYWKEYIYITPYDLTLDAIEDIVSRSYLLQDISMTDNHKIHTDLKEYLINGDIKVSYLPNFNFSTKKLPIKYIRTKYIYQLCANLRKFYKHRWQNHIIRQSYNSVIRILEKQKFPVFMIINGLGEVVVGEPEHMINMKKHFLKDFRNQALRTKTYQLPSREAYVFISPLDAVEYYNYLQSKYPYSSNELRLKVFVGTFSEYYKRNRLPFKNIRFRLLPDLREIGKLLTVYRYNSNVLFNPKQIHGKNYFQGQPVYFMEPIVCKHIDKLTKKITKRHFPNLSALEENEYSSVFFSRRSALSVWTKYRRKFREYVLPKHPKLVVYNLENFLKEKYEPSAVGDSKVSFRFVPSYETYQYIKNIQRTKNPKLLTRTNIYTQVILLIKITINRVLWGMIRWYPPV